MKTLLKFSILLNLLLAGGLIFALMNRRGEQIPPSQVSLDAQPAAPEPTHSVSPVAVESAPAPFRWQQLDSQDDYRLFVENLRAIGCPENSIGDIVRGNVSRAFAWERARLKVGDSGSGPWSKASETQLISSLLGKMSPIGDIALSQGAYSPVEQKGAGQFISIAQNTGNIIRPSSDNAVAEISSQPQSAGASSPPSFFGNGNWSADAAQRAALSQAQQPLNRNNSGNQNPNTPAYYQNDGPGNSNPNNTPGPDPSQTAPSVPSGPPNPLGPNDPYALSAQDAMIINQQQYYDWFQTQVANSGEGSLNVNPGAFTTQ